MKKPEKMIVYNLFPLLAGRFGGWQKHMARAAEMGFNWVFVNPIQRPGASQSLYSISDYFDFNELLVDPASSLSPVDQVKAVMSSAQELGLKVMIDLVINHCAVDSALVKSHPEWFQWEHDGQIAHPFAFEGRKKVVWKDLARFDHQDTRDKEGLYRFFFGVVDFLAGLGFRGFRCDAAYQVPGGIWERLIRETKKKYPEARFFAETLGCPPDQTRRTAEAGFDYIFNSSKWWDFHSCWLMEQYALTREVAPSISFPESHDTVRLCEELGGNIEGLKQRYMFAAFFSAGVMMPVGFEFGFRRSLHVVKTRPEDYEKTEVDLTGFITGINKIKSGNTVFQEEALTAILHHDNPNILVMWKASSDGQQEALLILNKDIWNRQCFYVENLQGFVQAGTVLVDVSPEYPLDYIPAPFSYELRPGQGIVLISSK